MKRHTVFTWVPTVVAMVFLMTEKATAQYRAELIACTDGSSPAACRASAVTPDPDTGVILWNRDQLGATICVGVGIEPQEGACNFSGLAYLGHGCQEPGVLPFPLSASAGEDLALTVPCLDTTGVPVGDYSARSVASDCFDGTSLCGNVTFVN